MTREKLLRSSTYWFEFEQNELFRQVYQYMAEENINQTELAKRLNVSKGYISQILKGNFNYTLKKLIDLCLAIGIVPHIGYKKVEDIINEDVDLKAYYDSDISMFSKIIPINSSSIKDTPYFQDFPLQQIQLPVDGDNFITTTVIPTLKQA
ncbi:DNA-binding XRE family transcriptional regulator [Mucilaginibacter gracilis]|uniref:DNA-binding XRE family transcriptional regulator n=1 Tax=Mucilaginibacter gracilis TaxID=423350 RepID=A0A495J9V1_9SPHI|nr:helix-turn-helix transcriptional regulator [Mucilaginibacter gracilis]RKR84839.1 DNA-binding XRE family transcriptional regulator [Mucilaginibacter gracilis]